MTFSITLATHNLHKQAEIQSLLSSTGCVFKLPTDLAAPSETGITFEDNALLKAHFVSQHTSGWALADDSGLCVDSLAGAPGVATSEYGGWPILLENMRNITFRSAAFVCVFALVSPKGDEWLFKGSCEGTISLEARGSGTFGYDPVFIPHGDHRTFAEMSASEKHAFSHRGIAARALLDWWDREGRACVSA